MSVAEWSGVELPAAIAELAQRQQWVLWRPVVIAGETKKVPYQPNGEEAKSNDPATWSSYDDCHEALASGRYVGLGYVFSADDPYVGVDLDGCLDTEGPN